MNYTLRKETYCTSQIPYVCDLSCYCLEVLILPPVIMQNRYAWLPWFSSDFWVYFQSDSNWWKGTCRGRTGLIPSNYGKESKWQTKTYKPSILYKYIWKNFELLLNKMCIICDVYRLLWCRESFIRDNQWCNYNYCVHTWGWGLERIPALSIKSFHVFLLFISEQTFAWQKIKWVKIWCSLKALPLVCMQLSEYHSCVDGICLFSVAEQAESIDNPMHEAAKRGTQNTYI